LNERMKHKKLTQPKVALQGFSLAQCVSDGGEVQRSRQSLINNLHYNLQYYPACPVVLDLPKF
jgi:hypothetical protein